MSQVLSSINNLNHFSNQNSNKLILIKFTADWCRPCKLIKPFIEKKLEAYPETLYLEVSVDDDENAEIVEHFSVKAMPTFVFLENAKVLKTIVGSATNDLDAFFAEYYKEDA